MKKAIALLLILFGFATPVYANVPIPPPTPAYYYLQPEPVGVLLSIANATDYSFYALLKNQYGQVVTDQSDFTYTYTPEYFPDVIFSIAPFSACTNGIQSPCPEDHVAVHALYAGSVSSGNIKVQVKRNSTQRVVAETEFSVGVVSYPLNYLNVTYPDTGETLKVGDNVKVRWEVSGDAFDYYNIGAYYYDRYGQSHSSYIGSPTFGATSLDWTVPVELRGRQIKIYIQAVRNSIGIVGNNNSDYYSKVLPRLPLP